MKKQVVDNQQYESLLSMLNSKNDQDKVLGLVTIENVDFNKSLTKILLLRKKADISFDLWKEHAPKTIKKFKSIDVDISKNLKYKDILEIIIKQKQTEEDIQFFLDDFSKHLHTTIKDLGFDFIENTEIEIKLKHNDKTGISSESIQELNV